MMPPVSWGTAAEHVPPPARAAAEATVDVAAAASAGVLGVQAIRCPTPAAAAVGMAAASRMQLPQQPLALLAPAACMAPSLSTQASVMQCSPFIITALALDGSTVYQNRNSIRFYGDIARCIQATPEQQRPQVMQGLPTALLRSLFLLEGAQQLQQVLELLGQGPCRGEQDVMRDTDAAWSRVIRVPTNCCGTSATLSCHQLMDLALPASCAAACSCSGPPDPETPPAHAPVVPASCQQADDPPARRHAAAERRVPANSIARSPSLHARTLRRSLTAPFPGSRLSTYAADVDVRSAGAEGSDAMSRLQMLRVHSLGSETARLVPQRVQSLLNFSHAHRTRSQLYNPGGSCAVAGSTPCSPLKSSLSLGRAFAAPADNCGAGCRPPVSHGAAAAPPSHAAAGDAPPPFDDSCRLELLVTEEGSGCGGSTELERHAALKAQQPSPQDPLVRCGSVLPLPSSLVESSSRESSAQTPLLKAVLDASCGIQRPDLLQSHSDATSSVSSLSSAGEDPSARDEEEQECSWHDVTISRARDETDGKELLLIYQSDVTARTRLETMLSKLADMQLNTLCQIFPRHIIEFLSTDLSVRMDARDLTHLARSHQDISILFMDIVGFTSMSKQVTPAAVMAFLNSLFSAFDDLCELHNVHKVETAGDCYIVSSGVVVMDEEGFHQVQADHDPRQSTERVVAFAKDMLASSRKVLMPHNSCPVVIRIGVHTGSCVSGIVGNKLPKFAIFGDTMNTASRMESTCTPGRIQISATTHSLLTGNGHPGSLEAEWCPTGGIEVKGKGIMETFMWREPEGSGCRPGGPEQDLGLGPEDLGLGLGLGRGLSLNLGQRLGSLSELFEGLEAFVPFPGEGAGDSRLGPPPSGDRSHMRRVLKKQVSAQSPRGRGYEVGRSPVARRLSLGAESLRKKLVSGLSAGRCE